MLTIIFWDNGWTSFFLSKKIALRYSPPAGGNHEPAAAE
ncbi:hypothetical protein A225_1837 [Klebsiella michiganensis E718]|nr:hypothetical protein A225_1837 [Klebsiella michiganensis E718]